MIKREAEEKLRQLAGGFPAVSVTGPRQSGKTTLVKAVFPEKPYLLLEDPDTRAYAKEDPRSFLKQYEETGAIIDEIQHVPELFSPAASLPKTGGSRNVTRSGPERLTRKKRLLLRI